MSVIPKCGKCGGELNTGFTCTRCGTPYQTIVPGYETIAWPVDPKDARIAKLEARVRELEGAIQRGTNERT